MSSTAASSYAAVTEQPGQPASRIQLEMLEARYVWAAEQAREKDVLEAGCGAGMGLPVLAKVARSVHAGDVDAENLRAARAACAGIANVELRAFHAGQLPYPNESFDLVLLFEAIYYVPDVARFLAEAQRVLRPGGTLLIVTVNPEWRGFNPSPQSTRYWSEAELLAILGRAGFAARVQGAFLETAGYRESAINAIRRGAVALNLVPRTMRGKAWLKRIFYGSLTAVPRHLASVSRGPTLSAPSRHHRVLYAAGRRETA